MDRVYFIITIVSFVFIFLLIGFLLFSVIIACFFPCSFDHYFTLGDFSFCVHCGADLRPPLCDCGAVAKNTGFCADCGFCFDQLEGGDPDA